MSGKENRATWLGKRGKDHCAVCLVEGEPTRAAKKCDGVHFHQYCGARIVATKGGLTCQNKHPQSTIFAYVKKTKAEAIPIGESRRWGDYPR